jgi:hypothetical protein
VKALGVTVAGDLVFLATADDDQVVNVPPFRVSAPKLPDGSRESLLFLAAARRILDEVRPAKVGFLLPEPTYTASYDAFSGRAAAEALLAVACEEHQVEFERLPRQRVRSRLKVKGKLELAADTLLSASIGPYWKDRRLAALAALAVGR